MKRKTKGYNTLSTLNIKKCQFFPLRLHPKRLYMGQVTNKEQENMDEAFLVGVHLGQRPYIHPFKSLFEGPINPFLFTLLNLRFLFILKSYQDLVSARFNLYNNNGSHLSRLVLCFQRRFKFSNPGNERGRWSMDFHLLLKRLCLTLLLP